MLKNLGKESFQNDRLRFYYSITEAFDKGNDGNILILSSVLSYLEHPYDILNEIMNYNFEYIFIDRTPVINGAKDKITIQKVPPFIYNASYPCWLLSEDKLLSAFKSNYTIYDKFKSNAEKFLRGYIFKRKINA